jgi:Na+:H+ antiporter, NhaA family
MTALDDIRQPQSRSQLIQVFTSPFVRFAKMEAASGVLLLSATIAALVWANSPWEQSYHSAWGVQVSIGFGKFSLSESRLEWINDGLMSTFFFLVGLEIKREVLIGELSSLRKAAFPLMAAFGGAILPALLYLCVNYGGEGQKGWGVPMATDIAFALGMLALLGNRAPASLKLFVTALAIVDDIIAVVVIALFYTDRIYIFSLGLALVGLALCFGANLLGVRKPAVYAIIGIGVWVAVLKSGVHATVAGVLLAFTIPARTCIDRDLFLKRGYWFLDRFAAAPPNSSDAHLAVYSIKAQCGLFEAPLQQIEHYLQPWISFLVMPLFAFANAGVRMLGSGWAAAKHPVTWGVVLGLFVGKPAGIWVSSWATAKLGWARIPADLSWGTILGASWLGGIGFTMSLFIASLGFAGGAPLDMAKIGTIMGSLAAGTAGFVILLRQTKPGMSSAQALARSNLGGTNAARKSVC